MKQQQFKARDGITVWDDTSKWPPTEGRWLAANRISHWELFDRSVTWPDGSSPIAHGQWDAIVAVKRLMTSHEINKSYWDRIKSLFKLIEQ